MVPLDIRTATDQQYYTQWTDRRDHCNLLIHTLLNLHIHAVHIHVLMRDEKEGRKKQARSNKQTRQSNTAHPRQSRFVAGLPPPPRLLILEKRETLHMYLQTITLKSLICMMWILIFTCTKIIIIILYLM